MFGALAAGLAMLAAQRAKGLCSVDPHGPAVAKS